MTKMFEQDKKLEDFQKQCFRINEERFERMSYQERLQLFKDHPEEYRRLTYKGTKSQRTSGHKYSSQIRR